MKTELHRSHADEILLARSLETESQIGEHEDAVTSICQEAERFVPPTRSSVARRRRALESGVGSVAGEVVARLRRPVLVVNPVKA